MAANEGGKTRLDLAKERLLPLLERAPEAGPQGQEGGLETLGPGGGDVALQVVDGVEGAREGQARPLAKV